MLFCYYVFKRYYVSCTSVLLSKKKVLLYELNNLNNFNENLSPHICTQNSTKEVYKYNYIYILL